MQAQSCLARCLKRAMASTGQSMAVQEQEQGQGCRTVTLAVRSKGSHLSRRGPLLGVARVAVVYQISDARRALFGRSQLPQLAPPRVVVGDDLPQHHSKGPDVHLHGHQQHAQCWCECCKACLIHARRRSMQLCIALGVAWCASSAELLSWAGSVNVHVQT